MEYKKGDKFIIEIETEFEGEWNPYLEKHDRLYKAKGFNSLVFDEIGLGKLQSYPDEQALSVVRVHEKGYVEGLEDAWELVREMIDLNGNIIYQAFQTEKMNTILNGFTPQEAREAIDKAKEELNFEVGDVVQNIDGEIGFVTATNRKREGYIYVVWNDGSCGDVYILSIKKTGRTVDVKSILDGLQEVKDESDNSTENAEGY